jgi:cyclopropane fatty-acyl-phospholipid synthase-like methyltransferase
MDSRLLDPRFPRAGAYNPEWLIAGASSGSPVLWVTEWLCSALELRPGMRVLDLGCGRAVSSIFLRREFGVEVWATDLWFSATENLQRIREAGVGDGVFPIHADARKLPYGEEFFDAILSVDSLYYYGTDDLYLNYLARFVKPGGTIAIAGAGFMKEMGEAIPEALRKWWEPSMRCMHSAEWWRSHWVKSGAVDLELADSMADGWKLWLEWQKVIAPDNLAEIQALEADAGEYLGFNRCIARRKMDAGLEPVVTSVPAQFTAADLLRKP